MDNTNLNLAFMNQIRPYECENLIRLGRAHDGGYVLPLVALSNASVLLSVGYGNDSSFERDFKKFSPKSRVILIDDIANFTRLFKSLFISFYTRAFMRTGHPRREWGNLLSFIRMEASDHIDFRNLKLAGQALNNDQTTLPILMSDFLDKQIILKIDIEGSEYECLQGIEEYSNVACILIEFHNIPDKMEEFSKHLDRLTNKFVLVNTHINNYSKIVEGIPEAVELCFLNKEYSRNNLRQAKKIPSELDQRNCVRFPEIQYEYLDD